MARLNALRPHWLQQPGHTTEVANLADQCLKEATTRHMRADMQANTVDECAQSPQAACC